MAQRNAAQPASRLSAAWSRSDRPDSFSTYVPRMLVRKAKLIAALRDVPLWSLVTEALSDYIQRFEGQHGALPTLSEPSSSDAPSS